jgi:predicted Zn-dependent protease
VGRYGEQIEYRKTKLGEQVFDSRLSVRSDPLDPALGTLPFTFDGDPYVPVTWVEHGVLTTLAYNSGYAHGTLLEPAGKPWSGAFRVDGSEPPVSIEEMIATTKRGLWVTRFWDIQGGDYATEQCTGLTRDGLWLIENGKVSHPVQNFRFTESPMFAFNNVEQIGTPVPVFNPECPAVMPAVKVRDFSFIALVDAV